MSAETWFIIAIVLFVLAGLLLAAAIIVFFALKIPEIIGELSGRNYAKELKRMREEAANPVPKFVAFEGGTTETGGSFNLQNIYTKNMKNGGEPEKPIIRRERRDEPNYEAPPTSAYMNAGVEPGGYPETSQIGDASAVETAANESMPRGTAHIGKIEQAAVDAQYDDDEQPTGVLTDNSQYDEDEQLTSVLTDNSGDGEQLTSVLRENSEQLTGVLNENPYGEDETPTDILREPDDITSELSKPTDGGQGFTEIFTNTGDDADGGFVITRSVKEVHTEEVIA